MENQAAIRQPNGDYRVESSGGGKIYTVEMFGLRADSCTCPHFVLDHESCEHMATAEEAEKRFQQAKEPPPPLFLQAELTRPAGFSLLKK